MEYKKEKKNTKNSVGNRVKKKKKSNVLPLLASKEKKDREGGRNNI